jgi:hypothetical protein
MVADHSHIGPVISLAISITCTLLAPSSTQVADFICSNAEKFINGLLNALETLVWNAKVGAADRLVTCFTKLGT